MSCEWVRKEGEHNGLEGARAGRLQEGVPIG